MFEPVKAIILSRTRHSDKLDIVNLYTDRFGRVSVPMPVGSSRSARLLTARTQPLSLIEAQIDFRPQREMQRLRQVAPAAVFPAIYSNPVRSAVAILISEFLTHALRETAPDPRLWRFLVASLRRLDATPRPENHHIVFLLSIAPLLGFAPQLGSLPRPDFFDMRAGTFTSHRPPHNDILIGRDARVAALLWTYGDSAVGRFAGNGRDRSAMLDVLLRYYALHVPGVDSLRSPGVLRSLFG